MNKTAILAATVIVSIVFGLLSSASATIVIFDDKSEFLASTGATTDMPAPLADEGLVIGSTSPGLSHSIGSYTFSLGSGAIKMFVGIKNHPVAVANNDWTLLHDGADLALSGPDSLNVAISPSGTDPVFAFGFDIVEPSEINLFPGPGGAFEESRFLVTLYNGASWVTAFQFEPPNDELAFAGVWTDRPFDSVEITEVVGGAENEFYGHFYAGTTPTPEPTTVCLFALGGLCLLRRRQKQR